MLVQSKSRQIIYNLAFLIGSMVEKSTDGVRWGKTLGLRQVDICVALADVGLCLKGGPSSLARLMCNLIHVGVYRG